MYVIIAQEEEKDLVKHFGFDNKKTIVTGVGAINVIKSLKNLPCNSNIVNIGYVGSNCFKIGTVVKINKVATQHEISKFDEQPHVLNVLKHIKGEIAPCYTSTDFVSKTIKKEKCVFDMELAFIKSMFDNVVSIKVVSDNLNYLDYKKSVENKVK